MRDLITDDNQELEINNGDFVTGESDEQHQEALIVDNPGEYKENPDACVGINTYLNDHNTDELLREVRHQFEKDGMTVKEIAFEETTGDLTYDASYNS